MDGDNIIERQVELPNARDLIQVDSIISIPRSEFLMLRELLETAFRPRVEFDPVNPNMAKMRQEAFAITNANIKSALDLLAKMK